MVFKLESIVPWGRSLTNYINMFALTAADLRGQILDCGGGPASFNAEMTAQGYHVISCDPIYQFSPEQITERIQATSQAIVDGVSANSDRFVWREYRSPEQMGELRLAAMQQFLADFASGREAGRYIIGRLPELPFSDHQFDLALCSHLLFSYSNLLSLEFHLRSLLELCRVARQVRVFPLVEQFSGERSPYLEPIMNQLVSQGYQVSLQSVAYEFQKGGNQLLRIQTS